MGAQELAGSFSVGPLLRQRSWPLPKPAHPLLPALVCLAGTKPGHHTLRVTRKGETPALIPMAPRTARTVYPAVGDREGGPIFVHDGRRMERHHAARIIRRLARQAGIDKKISPHSLRHSSITATLDAGVPLRDVQEAASHADPRTTMRYDRARRSLDRHATYIVATFVAGASR